MPELKKLKTAFNGQRNSAKKRGISWEFTFDTWLEVWSLSGRLADRGRGAGKFVMARMRDLGPYSPANVEVILATQNSVDRWKNKPRTKAEQGLSQVGLGRGWTFRRGVYQVYRSKQYIGVFHSAVEAEKAYSKACADWKTSVGASL